MKRFSLIILMLVLTISPVFANGLPTYEEGSGSGLLKIDENSGISLTEETVRYKLSSKPTEYSSYMFGINSYFDDNLVAEVTVTYKMKCTGDAEDTVMYFVLPVIETGHIYFEEEDITKAIFTEPLPENIDWAPLGLQDYQTRDMRFDTAKIPLSFDAGEEKTLVINYVPSSGFNRSASNINGVYDFEYYLTPANYWQGDAIVNLEIDAPKDLSFKSNIKMKKNEEGIYSSRLDQIPDHEWILHVSHMHDRYFYTNSSILQNFIIIILLFALFQSYRLVKESNRYKYRELIYLVCCFIWFKTNIDIFGYPFGPFFVWFGYIIIFIVVPVIYGYNIYKNS
ncbi:hypothetical protein EZV73_11640 [Acidaminobacter sp. JC074]|uniref:hypothetical protein n=1 Tax=Acidaminobacter sp. JC074 TaxID=2530199 RepID=UPI001F0DE082|nr:hypothetical protein [Acidaminobacter sp. JC074]MCH4888231.1 hypothetical protein [Acidaminobacter sp. JC074]